mgnify:FL=1|tara:strand:- start:482 stop:865 length:384 start_codon:yes stop_codon:yes gene_type:complete
MNRVQVAGWLTDVPEYGMTNGGKTYANFTIGIMASKKGAETVFIDCVAYGVPAERFQNAQTGKGEFIVIENASLIESKYQNKEGTTIRKIKLNVFGFINKKLFIKGDSEEVQERTMAEAYNAMPQYS